MTEWKKLLLLVAAFLVLYLVPWEHEVVLGAVAAGLSLLGEYVREHTLTCLVPAFFIAGAMAVFVRKEAVLKYLGPAAKRYIAYPVASLAGGVLAVCSCTILPLFAGIYTMGGGVGPATTFLFAGPAINIMAVFLTGERLGWDMSIARIIASIAIAIVTGLIMAALFKRDDEERVGFDPGEMPEPRFSTGFLALFLGLQVVNLVVLTLRLPAHPAWTIARWAAVALLMTAVAAMVGWVLRGPDRRQWVGETWSFTKMILPLLFAGVFAAGVIKELLPEEAVDRLVGGNRLGSNAFASVFGAVMYFATLTEIPIIEGLMALGMGKGPALALFLSGYSLSIPNMIVLGRLMGVKQASAYIGLIVAFSTIAGMVFGMT